jgi:hypothetical protein
MPAILSLLVSKLGLAGMAIIAVLAVISVQTLRLHHAKAELTALRASEGAAKADVKAHEAAASQISIQAGDRLKAQRDQVRTVTKTLIEKVKVYVPASADAACVVPLGFVQLHDNAAAGLPGAASGPGSFQTPSRIPLSVVANTVIENYGIAHDWRAEVMAWRGWYAEQKAAWGH